MGIHKTVSRKLHICAWLVIMAPAARLACAAVPETQPGRAPAIADSPPKIALQTFVRAVLAGDEKTYLELLNFHGDENRKTAQVLLKQVGSRQKLRQAVRDIFGERARDFSAGMSEAEIAATDKSLAAAAVEQNGDQARITFVEGPVYVLAKADGKWKLDFDKTQAGMGPLMPAGQIDTIARQTAGIDQLTADVIARKIAGLEEVEGRLHSIDMMVAALLMPAAPATTRP